MSAPGAYAKGTPIIRKFPFTFDSPGLLTGRTVYTPRVGDILLDAWIEVDTAWDGTTPLGDVGTFVGQNYGLYSASFDCVKMSAVDIAAGGTGLLSQDNGSGVASLVSTIQAYASAQGKRNVPAKFTAANPIKVVVSQDGTNTGADPGSTQGAAVPYLVTATPL